MVPCLDFCFNRPWAHAGDRLSPGRQSLKGVFVISFDLNACFMAPYAFQENPRYSIILIFAPYLSPNSSPSPFHFTAFDSLSPHPPIRRTRDQIQIGPDMAQKREKEGTEFKVQENLNICTPPQSISTAPPHVPASRAAEGSDPKISSACEESRASSGLAPDPAEKGALKRPREVNRCSGSGCRKRIGLMGFMCRCGEVFCSEHRYSDRHECSYDYKAAGREAIARENPVIRAAKILKV